MTRGSAVLSRARLLLFVLAAAVLLRLLYLGEQWATSVLFRQLLLDEQEMAETAHGLLMGHGFGPEPLFKAPLYPALLAGIMMLFGDAWFFAVRLLQHLAGATLVCAAWDCARRLAPPGRTRNWCGLAAAIAMAFYGPFIRLENCPNLDGLVAVFQSLMVWSLVRMGTLVSFHTALRWTLFSGCLGAAAWLTRPTIGPVLPLLGAWVWFAARSGWSVGSRHRTGGTSAQAAKCLVSFILPVVVAAGAMGARNAGAGGELMIMPWQGGYSFYEANRRGANGRYYVQSEFALSSTGNPARALAESGFRRAVAERQTPPPAANRFFSALNRYWFDRARQEILAAPGNWLRLMLAKSVYLVSDREIFNYEEYDVQRHLSAILRWMPFSFGWFWPFALASLAMVFGLRQCGHASRTARSGTAPCHPNRNRLFVLLWLYTLMLGGAICLYFTSGRLRMPLAFPAVVLAAGGLARLVHCRNLVRVCAYALLLVLGAVLSWGDWWGVRSDSHRHTEYARLSNAAWRDGQFARALEFAEKAAGEAPGYPTLSLLRGQALYSLGRRADAADAFEDSMRRLPGDPVAPYNLGLIRYYDDGQTTEALRLFEAALQRQPAYHSAAWMSVLARLRLGDTSGAAGIMAPYRDMIGPNAPLTLLTAAIALQRHRGDNDGALKLRELVGHRFGEAGLREVRRDELLLEPGR